MLANGDLAAARPKSEPALVHDEPMTTAAADASAKPKRWSARFAVATLFVLMAAEAGAPLLALAALGIQPLETGASGLTSVGLIAIVATLAMGLWCRSWRAWAAWIWLPLGAITVVAFVIVNLTVAPHIAGSGPWCEQRRVAVESGERALADAIAYSWNPVGVAGGGISQTHPPSPPRPRDGSFFGDARALTEEATYERWLEQRGPQLQQSAEQLRMQYDAHCEV